MPKTPEQKKEEKDKLQRMYRNKMEVLELHVQKIFVPEYQFLKQRKWKVDYALPCCKLAIEIEGGTWIGGGHSRGSGMNEDMEKYNNLAILGWRLLRFTPNNLKDNSYLDIFEKYMDNNPCSHTLTIGQSKLFP